MRVHVFILLLLLTARLQVNSQQLRLGKSPLALQKSAILELESDNQGMLFPRITDTVNINALMPPDGMVIYFIPSAQLMVRSQGSWKGLSSSMALSRLTDASITSPTNGQILRYNGTSWVNTSAPFLSTVDTGNISNFHVKVKSLFTAGNGLSYANGRFANTGVLSLNGNTGALTMDTGYISNFHLKTKSLFSAGSGISYNAATGVISSSINSGSFWNLGGNSGIDAATQYLGTSDDRKLSLRSNGAEYVEMGRRQTLGLVQSYPEYTNPDEQILHLKSAVQFFAPAAQFYKPKIYADANGNFRTKGSSAGTDMFEFGATGTNNDGGFELIIGDDGDEPIVFTSYHYLNGTSEMMRLQSGRMAVGSNAFDATNPEKLLIDAGVTNSYNLMTGKGSINNYLQINVQNRSNGSQASSDIVATADNGSETNNFIDMGINSSGFTNTSYPIISGINNAYLYSTGNDFVIGNASASRKLKFFTGGYSAASERMTITSAGNVGIGATDPTTTLHVKSTSSGNSGLRLENLTSASSSTSNASPIGVDASGNVVKVVAPVVYSGGANGGTAAIDVVTKVWVAEVANTSSGTQTITLPSNLSFANILNIQVTAKGGTDLTNSPIASVASNTTSQIVVRVTESKLTGVLIGGSIEGLEMHTSTATRIYIRVEGN